MSHEWRPRIRVSRKRPVTRKGNVIVVVTKLEEEAEAIEAFLVTMFEAAKRDEAKAKEKLEQIRLDAQVTALVGAELKEGEVLGEPPAAVEAEDAEFTPVEAAEQRDIDSIPDAEAK